MNDLRIDKTDLQIISLLLKNAKTPYKEISKKLKISMGTVHVRVKKLESLKIIKGFLLDVDFEKLGYNLVVFIGLIINGKYHENVVKELMKINELIELHHTTGKYHMLAKLICKNPSQLREILIHKINSIEGVEKTETTISLSELISKAGVY
ncbi:MAG: Lrp/AsnC ligand binding domain-containing protein [Marinilabiliales bacterium]